MKRKTIALTFIIFSLQSGVHSSGKEKSFELTTRFKRNPKIWGTYKVAKESLSLNNTSWNLPQKVSDLVISKGHLTFVRETKENKATKVVVERIPYKKERRNYKNKDKTALQEKLDRLLTKTLSEQLRLKKSESLSYERVNCARIRSGLECTVKGQITKR